MRPVCPTCCTHPKTGKYPVLSEHDGKCRTCPVCDGKFNEQGLPITYHKTTQQKQDDTGEGENPGGYMTAFERTPMNEEVQRQWIRYFLNKWSLWDKNYVIYRIAEMLDVRPGIVRAETENKERFYFIE